MAVWYVTSTTLTVDANNQVTGSSDKTIRQWDVATGQCILTTETLTSIIHLLRICTLR
jgi:division protein 1